ncbi:MAG: c-type cytochrome [Chthoniobacter sp.]|nr:c-type cytochrome [Chthoniobacter sp.]
MHVLKPAGSALMLLFAAIPFTGVAANESTPASAIQVREGFRVERLCSENSWVAMCFDDQGNIYASQQGPRICRITPPPVGAAEGGCKVEELAHYGLNQTQGMAFIGGALYLVRHGDHSKERFKPDDIVRLKVQDDGKLGEPERIFEFPAVPGENVGWDGEHGLHAIAAGPDGKSIYVIGGDTMRLPVEKSRTPAHWNRDSWGRQFQKEAYAGGWVMRADLDGKNAEVICKGLRNSYDIAFNHYGDLFTYDSDLEFSIGMPEYRPTAIRQILSGTDSGWAGRAGDMKWSWTSKWEDIQPPLKNVGPGSPTGVCFGYGAKFPAKYQEALFACDWSYGRLFAVHLTPVGAGYTAEVETFLSASGLPIADLAVSPKDGAIYFVTGGRGTHGGLYRIVYAGNEPASPAQPRPLDAATKALRDLREKLEAFHGAPNSAALAFVWPQLAHQDRAIRGAARVALEWQPVAEWKARAFAEKDPRIALQALLALARSTDGDATVQAELLDALERMDLAKLSPDEQCWYLRIITVSAIRHGMYAKDVAAAIVARIEPLLPSADRRVNEEIVAACAALGSKTFLAKGIELLEKSRTQEEQIFFTKVLNSTRDQAPWTAELRERFFQTVVRTVPNWKGGGWVKPLREEEFRHIEGKLTEEQRKKFADVITAARKPADVVPTATRTFVKEWKLEDFTPAMEAGLKGKRDLKNGENLFAATGCIACHNFRGDGGLAGPDLTSVGGRYTARDLLDNILTPSKVINEQYALTTFTKKDGSQIVGRLVNMSGDDLIVATNPMDPGGSETHFSPRLLAKTEPSPVSLMPSGLLNTLTEADLLDLLAYLTQPAAEQPSQKQRSR